MAVLSKTEGFVKLVLSEPLRTKNFSRIGWATFSSEESASAAVKSLDGSNVPLESEAESRVGGESGTDPMQADGGDKEGTETEHGDGKAESRISGGGLGTGRGGRGEDGRKARAVLHGQQFRLSCTTSRGVQQHKLGVKTCHPVASTPRRLAADLPLLVDLCRSFDAERGVRDNAILARVEAAGEDVEVGVKVDALVHYLRRVHLFCYYRCEEYNDMGEMIRKGAATLVRPTPEAGGRDDGQESDWERSLVARIRQRIALASDSLGARNAAFPGGMLTSDAVMALAGEGDGDDSRDDAPAGPAHDSQKMLLTAFFTRNCFEKEKGQKYQCEIPYKGTNKVFKAPEFVHKHLWNKHWGAVKKELYLMAFLTDPQASALAHSVGPGTGTGGGGWGARGALGHHMSAPPFKDRSGGGSMRGMHPMAAMAMMERGMPPPGALRGGGRMSGGGPQDRFGRGGQMGHPRGGGLDAAAGGGGGQRQDPRNVKAYVDLDASAGASSSVYDIDYRTPDY